MNNNDRNAQSPDERPTQAQEQRMSLKDLAKVCRTVDHDIAIIDGRVYLHRTDPASEITRSELARRAYLIAAEEPWDFDINSILREVEPGEQQEAVRAAIGFFILNAADGGGLKDCLESLLEDLFSGRYPELDRLYMIALAELAGQDDEVEEILRDQLQRAAASKLDLKAEINRAIPTLASSLKVL